MPTNAGIVLFGRDRAEHHLDDARWRCIRYPGLTKSTKAISPLDFEGQTVLEAVRDVAAYIREQGGTVRTIEGLDRQDRPAFSEDVVREVLFNAVAHANYEVKGCKLDVSVYTDRVEVQSPGTWPPGYRFEDLQDGVSQARNRAIARTLRTLHYMEEQGTIWARVQEAVAEGYPEPRWELHGPVLRVVVPKHALFADVSSSQSVSETNAKVETTRSVVARRRRILAVLHEQAPEDVSVRDLPELVGASRPTVYRDVSELERQGRLRKTARGRVTATPADD